MYVSMYILVFVLYGLITKKYKKNTYYMFLFRVCVCVRVCLFLTMIVKCTIIIDYIIIIISLLFKIIIAQYLVLISHHNYLVTSLVK